MYSKTTLTDQWSCN